MANWFQVDWEKLNQPRPGQIKGVEVTVYFSPYDMPEAVKGEYDTVKGRFAIRFRYLGGEEPIEYRDPDEDIQLGIGKQTQRLHEILVDVQRLKASIVAIEMCEGPSVLEKNVANKVEQAITKLASSSATTTTLPPTDNYKVASKALEQQRDHVFSGLAAACG